MTARDEAVAAMFPDDDPDTNMTRRWAGRLLDRIPPDVLARLARDTGGLVHDAWRDSTQNVMGGAAALYEVDDDPENHGHDIRDSSLVPLYRLAEITPHNKGTPT